MIELPDSQLNRAVEVNVSPLKKQKKTRIKKSKISIYRGALKVTLSNDKIDEDIRKMRDEWERTF